MALNIPSTATEVVSRARVDVQRELPESNPFLKNSWLGALVVAFANRVFDFYFALTRAQLEAIPDTAVLFLERWAAIWNILRNAALNSTGRIAITGTVGGLITIDLTTWFTSDGNQYIATESGTIALQSLAIASITRVGSVATVTTVEDHFLSSSVLVTITGSSGGDYDVTDETIVVTGAKTFTFTILGTPADDDPSSALLGFTSVSIQVKSIGFGATNDQILDTILTLQSPIFNVDDTAGVDFGTIGGGSSQEIDSSLRDRMLDRIQNPIAHFNVSEIIAVAKSISGVTRVFVEKITPAVGQVTVYFMRDNDSNPIPDGSEVAIVKAAIEEITPANTDTLDVIVAAPTPIIQAFTFTAISPDTTSMRTAIENSLKLFFAEKTEVGVTIVEEAYNAAIFQTIDINGALLLSFTLSVPAADITIASGEIGQLGTVTFS